MASDFMVFLDAGHGGLDPQGRYTTAPSKMFRHRSGEFHDGPLFYEGVWNRTLTQRVAAKLQQLQIPYLIVSHEYLDISLNYRVEVANWYYRNYRKGVYISNHANASSSHTARGFEVYTSPGRTQADVLAELHWNHVRDLLEERINYRSSLGDGDHDKEARFFVLARTLMPAMLVEHLFFDNADDARLLMDPEIVERFAEAQVRSIVAWMNT